MLWHISFPTRKPYHYVADDRLLILTLACCGSTVVSDEYFSKLHCDDSNVSEANRL